MSIPQATIDKAADYGMTPEELHKRNCDRYAVQSAAEDVAKWLAKEATWLRRITQHQVDPSFDYSVRSMPGKNAKHQAYSRGTTLAMLLGEPRPMTSADLGRLVGLAFAHYMGR